MGKIYITMPQNYFCWEFFGIFFAVFFCFAAVTSQQQTDCYYKEVKLSNSSSVNVTEDGEHVTSSSTSCVPCRKCPDGFFERRKCTESHDTECQDCGNKDGEGHGNEDYLKKCSGEGSNTVAHDFPEVGSGEEPVSSGESSPLDNVLPAFPTKVDMPGELPPISGGITIDLPAFPRDNDTTTAASLVYIKGVTPAEASFQVWWILLTVLLVLVVCFVIFIVARKVKKRKSNDLEQTKDVPDGTKSTVIDMNGDPAAEPLANGNHPQKSQDQAGENTPMMPASGNPSEQTSNENPEKQ